jgi:hypothetical protein
MPNLYSLKFLTPTVANFMARSIVGQDKEMINSLTVMKNDPDRARRVIMILLPGLSQWAVVKTKEAVVIEDPEAVAQELVEYSLELFSEEVAAIK